MCRSRNKYINGTVGSSTKTHTKHERTCFFFNKECSLISAAPESHLSTKDSITGIKEIVPKQQKDNLIRNLCSYNKSIFLCQKGTWRTYVTPIAASCTFNHVSAREQFIRCQAHHFSFLINLDMKIVH